MELRAILAASVLLLVAPASAGATTFCVANPPGCVGTDAPSIAGAITEAADEGANPGRDTIRLGPTDFGAALTVAAGNVVDIIGSGAATRLEATTSQPALAIDEPQSAVRDLILILSGDDNAVGLRLAGTATNLLVATNSTTQINALGVDVRAGGMLVSSRVALRVDPLSLSTAARAAVPGTPRPVVRDSSLTGVYAFLATADALIQRSVLVGSFRGAIAYGPSTLAVENSEIRRPSGVTTSGLIALDASTVGAATGNATVDARHVTVVGDSMTTAVSVTADGSGGNAAVTVRDSLLHVVADTVHAGVVDSPAGSTATFNSSYSNYPVPPTATGSGAVVAEDHVTRFSDPVFLNPGTIDFRLRADSPLIDIGTPGALDLLESPLDIATAPRIVDGDGDAVARRDIGAWEFTGVAPTVGIPTASPSTAAAGQAVTFAVTAGDADPGDTVTVTWTFSDGATEIGTTASHAFATSGGHTATATARDRAGHAAASAPVAITVPAPPATALPPATTLPPATDPAPGPITRPVVDCAATRRGTARANRLTGTSRSDRILGLGGADRILGRGGNDCLFGGAGNDTLDGGAGADHLNGGAGRDTIKGGAGADAITGGAGTDTISARDGTRDTIDCGTGRDRVRADTKDRLRRCERRLP